MACLFNRLYAELVSLSPLTCACNFRFSLRAPVSASFVSLLRRSCRRAFFKFMNAYHAAYLAHISGVTSHCACACASIMLIAGSLWMCNYIRLWSLFHGDSLNFFHFIYSASLRWLFACFWCNTLCNWIACHAAALLSPLIFFFINSLPTLIYFYFSFSFHSPLNWRSQLNLLLCKIMSWCCATATTFLFHLFWSPSSAPAFTSGSTSVAVYLFLAEIAVQWHFR